ncbi:MAG: Radical SAM domain protein [candidate division CPR3 bacterium GW2011_GWE2_35_7]|nr:MAG: Radical SAM domain protein [candidate division CPR3 bacterium GW2011_GWE2_35_7]
MLDSVYKKLQILGPSAKYDTCGPKEGIDQKIPGVYFAKTGNGYCRLFKVLQTNSCIKHCRYCVNQACMNTPRVVLSPDDMARTFMELIGKRLVDGLFLSSGILGNSQTAMSKIFMPGVTDIYLEEALKLSNRVSLNLEAPNSERLKEISPDKNYENEVLKTVIRLNTIRQKYNLKYKRNISQTTQFVVGATRDSDAEILDTMQLLYRQLKLTRIFYSSFSPVSGSPLQDVTASTTKRGHRLYQADFLLRFYGFQKNDIVLGKNKMLSLQKDPKLAFAESHPELYPIEINTSPRNNLLKIPGIGPDNVDKIIQRRIKYGKINSHFELKKMGISIRRASQFITVNGKYEAQLNLF